MLTEQKRERRCLLVVVLSLALGLLPLASTAHAAPRASAGGTWTSYTNGNNVLALAQQGNTLWAGGMGGLVRWDMTTGNYVKYTARDGLPDNQVSSVALQANGALWAGLGSWNGGLVVFQGGRWTTYTSDNGLVSNFVLCVAVDPQGRKWAGTVRGVSVLDDHGTPHDSRDDAWLSFRRSDGLVNEGVMAIAFDAAGRKWFATSGGLSVLDDKGTPEKGDDVWTSFTSADGLGHNEVRALLVDRAGLKWCVTRTDVSLLDDGGTPHDKRDDRWTHFSTADGLIADDPRAIAEDGAGLKWLGTTSGLCVLEDGGTPSDKSDDRWTIFSQPDGLVDEWVRALAVTGNQVYVGCSGSASRLDHRGTPRDKTDDQWSRWVTADALPSNNVTALATQGAGLVWIGTDTYLTAYDGSTWTNVARATVRCIVLDRNGVKWVAAGSTVLALDDRGTPHQTGDDVSTQFTSADGLLAGGPEAIAIDAAGRKWVGTGQGASVLSDNGTPHVKGDDTWTSFTSADGMAGNWVHAVAVDGPNRVWFVHEGNGASVLDHKGTPHDKRDDVWTTFSDADGLTSDSIYSVVVDSAGRKWFGGCEGLHVLSDGGANSKADDVWTTFHVGDCNQGLAFHARGWKWIATGWSGVLALHDGGTPHNTADDVWVTYAVAQGLVDDRAQCVAVSPSNVVWVGADGGLSRFEGEPFVPRYWLRLPVVLKQAWD